MNKKPDTHESAKADSIQRRLPPLLRQAWYSLNQAFRKRIQHLNITPDQFTLLRWLTELDEEDSGPTQKELAGCMSSDPNTIASLVKRMEAAELIKRIPDKQDKRANRVQITRKGKQVFGKAKDLAIDLQEEVLSALPVDEREQFLISLEKIADKCSDMNS